MLPACAADVCCRVAGVLASRTRDAGCWRGESADTGGRGLSPRPTWSALTGALSTEDLVPKLSVASGGVVLLLAYLAISTPDQGCTWDDMEMYLDMKFNMT